MKKTLIKIVAVMTVSIFLVTNFAYAYPVRQDQTIASHLTKEIPGAIKAEAGSLSKTDEIAVPDSIPDDVVRMVKDGDLAGAREFLGQKKESYPDEAAAKIAEDLATYKQQIVFAIDIVLNPSLTYGERLNKHGIDEATGISSLMDGRGIRNARANKVQFIDFLEEVISKAWTIPIRENLKSAEYFRDADIVNIVYYDAGSESQVFLVAYVRDGVLSVEAFKLLSFAGEKVTSAMRAIEDHKKALEDGVAHIIPYKVIQAKVPSELYGASQWEAYKQKDRDDCDIIIQRLAIDITNEEKMTKKLDELLKNVPQKESIIETLKENNSIIPIADWLRSQENDKELDQAIHKVHVAITHYLEHGKFIEDYEADGLIVYNNEVVVMDIGGLKSALDKSKIKSYLSKLEEGKSESELSAFEEYYFGNERIKTRLNAIKKEGEYNATWKRLETLAEAAKDRFAAYAKVRNAAGISVKFSDTLNDQISDLAARGNSVTREEIMLLANKIIDEVTKQETMNKLQKNMEKFFIEIDEEMLKKPIEEQLREYLRLNIEEFVKINEEWELLTKVPEVSSIIDVAHYKSA